MDGYVASFWLALAACAVTSYGLRGMLATSNGEGEAPTGTFRRFQMAYLAAWVLAGMGDWLQGPYVYPLYQLYGYGQQEIAWLFVAGFLSSAVFGTVIGSVADAWGRRRFAIGFCVIYSASCLTKLSPNFAVLLLGRLLAGIATSLLFSVFESWVVCEHGKQGAQWARLQVGTLRTCA